MLQSAVECADAALVKLSRHIVLSMPTCTDLFLSSGLEGYINMRANNSIEWVNEWGAKYGLVGSAYVPVANRLFSDRMLRASRTMLSHALRGAVEERQ